tara:strand:+ start:6324 stop:7772 length:1449 start_codon:yes stop_codon:yes gene_type:complete
MKKTTILSTLLIGAISLQTVANSYDPPIKKTPKKPNIIVIMADDLGYADVGFNGCKDIPTPNIDRIAKNGVKFTNGYTSYSVCGPSRAGFMTGRYQQRFGFERNPQYQPHDPNMGLPKSENTLAESLQQVNYTSGIIGKWHLGADISNHPLNRGFTEFFGHLGGGHQYMPKSLTIKDSYTAKDEQESYRTWILRNHTPVKTEHYLTDEFSNEAVAFVERNKKDPFFLFLSYNAPHNPLQSTKKYLDRFPNIKNKKRKTYAAMVSAVDDGVGRVLDKLEALNLDENTLIFFLSDNGGPESKNASNNGVLRDGKGSAYEGGFRVPFAMQWKGHVKPSVYEHPVSSLDIFATITGLAKAPIKKDKPLDGVNLIPFLTGENNTVPHETIYLRKFDSKLHAIRHNDLKLIVKWKSETKELYNLKDDISEKNNLAKKYPEEVKKLNKMGLAWESELIDPIFLGLIHTESWQKKIQKNKKKKENKKKKK